LSAKHLIISIVKQSKPIYARVGAKSFSMGLTVIQILFFHIMLKTAWSMRLTLNDVAALHAQYSTERQTILQRSDWITHSLYNTPSNLLTCSCSTSCTASINMHNQSQPNNTRQHAQPITTKQHQATCTTNHNQMTHNHCKLSCSKRVLVTQWERRCSKNESFH
jgi:hypothetical protein